MNCCTTNIDQNPNNSSNRTHTPVHIHSMTPPDNITETSFSLQTTHPPTPSSPERMNTVTDTSLYISPGSHNTNVESVVDEQNQQPNPTKIRENFYIGDQLGEKSSNTIRCAFQNINSLQPKSNKKWLQSLRTCNDLRLDIVGFAETGINWSSRELRHRYTQDCNRQYSHNKINHSKNKTPCNKSYLPGGTMQVCFGNITGRIDAALHDNNLMGRWSGHRFQVQQQRHIFFITAYLKT